MFCKMEDAGGDVCVNMDSGLRFRPGKEKHTGARVGIQIIFPDGHTQITVRGDYDTMCDRLSAVDAR